MTRSGRRDFVDWVKNSDVVQLDDFTRDGYQTVWLTTDAPTWHDTNDVTRRALKAGYTHRWNDEQGRLVFSTSGDDPRVTV
jgi:hypothetical protein